MHISTTKKGGYFVMIREELVKEIERGEKGVTADVEIIAKELRRQYMREWRKKNRDKCNAYLRNWRERNKEKVREYNRRYWLKKALENGKRTKETLKLERFLEGLDDDELRVLKEKLLKE